MSRQLVILLFAVISNCYHLEPVTEGTSQFDLYEQQQPKLQYVTLLYPYEVFCFGKNDFCTYYFVRISKQIFKTYLLRNKGIEFASCALPQVFALKQSFDDQLFKLVKLSDSHIALSNHSLYSRTNQSTMVTLFKMDFNLAIYLKLREEMNPDTMVIPLRVRLHVPIPRNTRWTASCNGTICRITNAFTVNCPNEKQFHCTNLTYFIDKGYLNSNQSETISYVSKANSRRLILKEETIENRVWPNSEIKYRVPLVTYVGNSDSLMVRLTEGGRNSIIHHFEGRNITQVYPLRYGMYAVTVADRRFYVVDGFGSQPEFGLRHSRESRSRGSDFSVHKAAEPRSSCSVFFDDPIRVETQLSPDYIVLCKEGLTCVIVSSECEVVYRRRYEFATIDIKWSYRQRYISHNRIEVTVTAKSKVDSFSETITLPPKNQLQQRPIFYEYEGANIWKVSYNESENSTFSNTNTYFFSFPKFYRPQYFTLKQKFLMMEIKKFYLLKFLIFFQESNLNISKIQLESILGNSSSFIQMKLTNSYNLLSLGLSKFWAYDGGRFDALAVSYRQHLTKEAKSFVSINLSEGYEVFWSIYNDKYVVTEISSNISNIPPLLASRSIIMLILPNGKPAAPKITIQLYYTSYQIYFIQIVVVGSFFLLFLVLLGILYLLLDCALKNQINWLKVRINLFVLTHRQLIRKYTHQTDDERCNICSYYIIIGHNVIQIYCRHKFHQQCFEERSISRTKGLGSAQYNSYPYCPVCMVKFTKTALQEFKITNKKYKAEITEITETRHQLDLDEEADFM